MWSRRITATLLVVSAVVLAAHPAAAQRNRQQHGGGKREGPPIDSAAVPRPDIKTGCAAFDVRITAGTLVTAVPTLGLPCGPIEPILVSTPAYDSAHRTVEMSIALINGGVDRLHAPAALVAGQGALTITGGAPAPRPIQPAPPAPIAPPTPVDSPKAPPPSSAAPGTVVLVGGGTPLSAAPTSRGPGAGPTDALQFLGADQQHVDSSSPAPTTVRWSYDKLLQPPSHDPVTADDGTIVLPAGDTSAKRTITILVPRGVTAFRVNLQGSGTYVFTVPGRAPDAVSRDEMDDSRSPDNIIANDPHFPGRVVRDKVWLMFRPDATPEQRQAVIDSVGGVIVGGMIRGQDRYYYVRIPANPDSGSAPLQRALRALAPMPQVQDVMADRIN
jgi:hypothetical protein